MSNFKTITSFHQRCIYDSALQRIDSYVCWCLLPVTMELAFQYANCSYTCVYTCLTLGVQLSVQFLITILVSQRRKILPLWKTCWRLWMKSRVMWKHTQKRHNILQSWRYLNPEPLSNKATGHHAAIFRLAQRKVSVFYSLTKEGVTKINSAFSAHFSTLLMPR
jgi:hypothetical protein